jgi:hypothetical protein
MPKKGSGFLRPVDGRATLGRRHPDVPDDLRNGRTPVIIDVVCRPNGRIALVTCGCAAFQAVGTCQDAWGASLFYVTMRRAGVMLENAITIRFHVRPADVRRRRIAPTGRKAP